jgi:hypothetical protein
MRRERRNQVDKPEVLSGSPLRNRKGKSDRIPHFALLQKGVVQSEPQKRKMKSLGAQKRVAFFGKLARL